MYIQTRSKTIPQSTAKLNALKSVIHCTRQTLTDIQNECLGEYLEDLKPYTEDIKLALDNLYVDLTNNHLYILEMSDEGDSIQYYYTELIPTVTLYKDDLGNLYYDEGLTEDGLHLLVLVEKIDDHYIYTHDTWYEDTDRLAELYTKIEVEVI